MTPVRLTAPASLLPRLLARLALTGLTPSTDAGVVLAVDDAGPADVVVRLVFDAPPADTLGWMMYVGARPEALPDVRPWLDALAPVAGGWCHVGPSQAAHYLATLAALQQRHCMLAWQTLTVNDSGQPQFNPDHWLALNQATQAAMQEATTAYLASEPPATAPATLVARAIAAFPKPT
ncbi:hypothetical protein ACTSKR_07960 [Chitinibacteraceae bacterium HSL-7]